MAMKSPRGETEENDLIISKSRESSPTKKKPPATFKEKIANKFKEINGKLGENEVSNLIRDTKKQLLPAKFSSIEDMNSSKVLAQHKHAIFQGYGMGNEVKGVRITKDSKRIIAYAPEWIRVLDLEAQEIRQFNRGPNSGLGYDITSIAVTSDDKYLVVAGGSIEVYDLEIRRQKENFEIKHGKIMSILLTEDNKHLIVGLDDRSIVMMDLETGEQSERFLEAHQGYFTPVTCSNDNKYILTDAEGRSVKLFDMEGRRVIYQFKDAHEVKIDCFAVTKDNKYLITATEDNTLTVINLETAEEAHSLKNAHPERINSLAVTSDSKYVVTGSQDGSVKVFEVEAGKEVHHFKRLHQDQITCIALSADDKFIITGSLDKSVKICLMPLQSLEIVQLSSQKHPPFLGNSPLSTFAPKAETNMDRWASLARKYPDLHTRGDRLTLLHLMAIYHPDQIDRCVFYPNFSVPFLVDAHQKTPLHYLLAHEKVDYTQAFAMLDYILDYVKDKSRRTQEEREAIFASLSVVLPFILLKAPTKNTVNFFQASMTNVPSADGTPLPTYGSEDKITVFTESLKVGKELLDQMEDEGEVKIVFRSSMLCFDYDPLSDDMNKLATTLTRIDDEEIFKIPVIAGLVDYLWGKTETILMFLGLSYSILITLISVHVGQGERQLGLEIVIIILGIFFLVLEFVQFFRAGRAYLKNPWNWIDIPHNLLILVFIITRFADVGLTEESSEDDVLAREWITTMVIIVGYMRWLAYFRLFESTRDLIQVIVSITQNMSGFMLILLFITISFSLIFLEFDRENGYPNNLYVSYGLMYGNVDDSELNASQKIIASFVLFILNVVLLNLLIAKMGDTYGKIQGSRILSDAHTRLGMVLEAQAFMKVFSKKKPERKGYLINCEPEEPRLRGAVRTEVDKRLEDVLRNQAEMKTRYEELIENQQEMRKKYEEVIRTQQEIKRKSTDDQNDIRRMFDQANDNHEKLMKELLEMKDIYENLRIVRINT